MARNFTRFTTSIWRDGEFTDLTPEQQALYFLLDGQAEVTAAGTLPLRPRRWANMARGWTVDRITDELCELAERGHIIIDGDTEEVLIVKFVKWDGGYTNSKRIPVIRDSARDIVSPVLRGVLARELRQLGLSEIASELASDSQRDRASDSASDTQSRSDRLRVTEGELGTPTPNPQSATPAPVAAATRAEVAVIEDRLTSQALIAEWIEHCQRRPPGQVVGQIAKSIDRMLAEGIDPADVRRGLAAWHAKGLSPSVLPSVVNECMNAPAINRGQAETDALFDRAAKRLGVVQ